MSIISFSGACSNISVSRLIDRRSSRKTRGPWATTLT